LDQNTARDIQKLIREGKLPDPRTGDLAVGMSLGAGSEGDFPIAGSIDYISNQLDPNTGSIQVRAVFPNEDMSLAAGMFARIRIPVAAPHQALLVNDRAIGTNQGQKYVAVVNDENKVEFHEVEVGQIHDGLREVHRFRTITEPGPDGKSVARQVEVLTPNDWVIVEGIMRARPGDKVDAQHVDMQTLLPEDGAAKEKTPPSAPK
jgi:multidrug efflux pump subunit AcrA (membrane-fusion protein)